MPPDGGRKDEPMSDHLFSGLKVIDCASWIAGPAAATIMSDFGADVIKIEPPGAGDPWRAPQRQRRGQRLLLAADVAQQTQPGDRPEARGRSRRAVSAGRGCRCVRHQLPAAGARSVEAGAGASAAAEPAADLRLVHRLWRGRRRSGEDRLRLHRLLGAHRADGRGAGRCGYAARALGARHGRPSQRHRPLCRDRHRAVPAREDRTRRRGAVLAAAERPVGQWLLRADAPVRRARAASADRASMRRTRSPTTIAAATAAGSSWRCSTRSGSCARCWPRSAARTWPTIRASPRRRRASRTPPRWSSNWMPCSPHATWRSGGRSSTAVGVTFGVVGTVDDVADDAQMQAIGALVPFADGRTLTVSSPFHLDGEAKVAPRRAPRSASTARTCCARPAIRPMRSAGCGRWACWPRS